jgi:type I restriction enzyme, S subunit
MKQSWHSESIEDLCEVEYGTRVVRKRDAGTIYPVYGGGGATFSMDTYNREDRMVIARFAMSKRCARFVDGKFFLNDSGLTISPLDDNTFDQDFLNYQILSLNDEIYSLARGTAQKNLNVNAFKKVQLSYPTSLEEQKQIVAKLDQCFEAIDKARANAAKNLENAKELFQSKLNDIFSQKGEGWVEKTFEELSSRIGDGLHGTPKYDEYGKYYFINGNNLNDGVIEIKGNTKRVNKEEFEKYKKELTGNTVLISINGTLGKVAFYNNEPVILGKSACYINFNDEVNKHYIKYLVKSPLFFKNMANLSTGATIKNFSLKSMRNYTLPLPPLKQQKQIVEVLDGLQKQTQSLESKYQQELNSLEELKKSILQKAFEGEL